MNEVERADHLQNLQRFIEYMDSGPPLEFVLQRDDTIPRPPTPLPMRQTLRDRYWYSRFRLALIILRLAEFIAGEGMRDYAD